MRPGGQPYNSEQMLSAKVKPIQKKVSSLFCFQWQVKIFEYAKADIIPNIFSLQVHMELSLDTCSSTYSTGKGEHLAMSVDGPNMKGPATYPRYSNALSFSRNYTHHHHCQPSASHCWTKTSLMAGHFILPSDSVVQLLSSFHMTDRDNTCICTIFVVES